VRAKCAAGESKCEASVHQVGGKCEPSAGQVQSESGPSAGQVRAKRRQPNAKQARSKCGLSADQAPTKCEASPLVHRSWLSCLVGLVPALACLSFPALSRLLGFLGFCLWPGQGWDGGVRYWSSFQLVTNSIANLVSNPASSLALYLKKIQSVQ
jgi:hypothetical protein